MSSDIFEILRGADLLAKGQVSRDIVTSLSAPKIFDIAEAVAEATLPVASFKATSSFRHSASLSLAGGRGECHYLGCRLQRVEELARFALMYSDATYVHNPLASYAPRQPRFASRNLDLLREVFYDDLCVLERFEPVVKSGHVILFSPSKHFHRSCLADAALGAGAGEKLRRAQLRLADEYLSRTKGSVRFLSSDKTHEFSLKGPALYYDHGGLVFTRPLSPDSKLFKAVQQQGEVLLSRAALRTLGFHEELAAAVVANVCNHLMMNYDLNSFFLTEKDIHIRFLQSLTQNTDIEKRNSVAFRNLTSIVPFVEDIPLKELIKLRKREQESFISYRAALTQAIDALRFQKSEFTERDARLLYSEVIAPRLASLELRIKSAKRDLITSAYRPIVGWVGAMSFGIYSGLIPAQLAGLATAVGFTQAASNILQKAMALGDCEQQARTNDLYFLWKVQRKAKKKPS
ncbi:MAG: hypothetical protein LAO23_00860 [Acidobacteriia bacterium]|nr:hypothetical protein [Terriglobia bacterium]